MQATYKAKRILDSNKGRRELSKDTQIMFRLIEHLKTIL